jgi:hypothetical protein
MKGSWLLSSTEETKEGTSSCDDLCSPKIPMVKELTSKVTTFGDGLQKVIKVN